MSKNIGVEKAITKAGGQKQLAHALGVSTQSISYYLTRSIPAKRAVQVARATGIPLQEIRPDIFGENACQA